MIDETTFRRESERALESLKQALIAAEDAGGSYAKSNTAPYTATAPAAPDYADQGITDDDIPF
jgi:hypothetical protein